MEVTLVGFFILIFFLAYGFLLPKLVEWKTIKKSFYRNKFNSSTCSCPKHCLLFLVGMSKAIYENIIIAVYTYMHPYWNTMHSLLEFPFQTFFSLLISSSMNAMRGNENCNLKPTAIGYSLSFISSQSAYVWENEIFWVNYAFFFSSF